MPLTVAAVRAAKPQEKTYRLADEKGMYLEITAAGGRYWRFKYRFAGKEKLLALGVFPDVSLAGAREARDDARRLLAKGADPSEAKKAAKRAASVASVNSFEAIAIEWFDRQKPKWTAGYADKIERRMRGDIFPAIGGRPISQITAQELLAALRKIEARGVYETAHRARQDCGHVFRYAIATGRAERDVAADVLGALHPVVTTHHASITDPEKIGALMRAIEGYDGSFITKSALLLAPLVFVRPGELRKAEWTEIDLDGAEWRIPGAKMKMRTPHIVPLSKQAVAILRKLKPLTGDDGYVFPGVRGRKRPMSENTINAALRRLGYATDEMTGHGFRSMASTLLNEQGYNRDWIERQLAHGDRDTVRAAYNYAEFLPERRKMMQAWATYLDGLLLM
ncbi:integrase [Paraburkholderia sp. BL6665CI2N2]|uniref:tyrosine-type recombinase/integrase n=1 Tax=Paraburkholderia sp. BL6665CI2N2 TaxID=1938806 RepID=UPI001064C21D|nr:integrase arm-type DNA-binding domain-containing protein [Paraburkholderia sp. BL6665CI2N2]TDY25762.1 integrase [Paraburkholderia sp. BL6665CI2N2]